MEWQTRGAEFRGKPPVRAERHEPNRLFPPVAAQDFAHRAGQIIITQHGKYAAEVGEGVFVRFQERLLRRMQISPEERYPAGHRAHREHLHLGALIAEVPLVWLSIGYADGALASLAQASYQSTCAS